MIRVFNEELDTFTTQERGTVTALNSVVDSTTLDDTVTGNGTALNPGVATVQEAAIVGHKYYVRAMAKVTNSVCATMRLSYGGVAHTFVTSPVSGTVYDLSTVITAVSTSDVLSMYHYYADAATANGKVMVLYSTLTIDLTAKFGAGLEWTSARMDKIKPLWSLAEVYAETWTRTICVNDFDTAGEKIIQPLSCVEIVHDNVDWRVELTADVSYLPWLKQDYILVLPTKEKGEQPFRINNIKVTSREVAFSARHVGYDLGNYICNLPFGYKWISGIAYLLARTLGYSLPVNQFYTTMPNWVGGEYVTYKGSTLIDNIDELRAVHGGHLTFDWWNVQILETIGADHGEVIEYGKNLQGAEVVEDWNSVCTQIYPIGNNKLTLGTATNMLTSATVYDRPYTRKVQFQTDDVVELESLGTAYMEANKVPKLNYKVQADTVQDVGLGDTIQVRSRQFTVLTNVLGYTFNVLTQRIVNVEFGNFRKDVKTVFSNIQADISDLRKQVVQENITMNDQINSIIYKTSSGSELMKLAAAHINKSVNGVFMVSVIDNGGPIRFYSGIVNFYNGIFCTAYTVASNGISVSSTLTDGTLNFSGVTGSPVITVTRIWQE